MSLSQQDLYAISVTERVCSAVSLLGTSVIVGTFLSSDLFRKPINRLVFYASLGNMMSNVATLISQSGIRAGTSSFLCQLQAFLIQWFMPADALWIFSMACNVYLTFFHKYTSEQLRRLEWKYVIFCYGLPFIPSFIFFFIKTEGRGRVYGSAILWCWISIPWDFLRVAIFYGPAWFVIFMTFVIYVRCGKLIYQKRKQLRNATSVDSGMDLKEIPSVHYSKVTEVRVTSELASPCNAGTTGAPKRSSTYDPYSISIEANRPEASGPREVDTSMQPVIHRRANSHTHPRTTATDANTAAYAYTKYAMLYFIALLVTWVPSTVNRAYALAKPTDFNFALNYTSSFVLPLQGFWNSIIYIAVSLPAFRSTIANLRKWRFQTPSPELPIHRHERGLGSRPYLPLGEDSQDLA